MCRRIQFFLLLSSWLGCGSETHLPADASPLSIPRLASDAGSASSARPLDPATFAGVHRPEATPCGIKPKDWVAWPQQPSGQACVSTRDCTGVGGHCMLADPNANAPSCTYDQCYSDADCRGLICSCERSRPDAANRCAFGECRTDEDCAITHLCSPAYGCSGDILSGVSYHCRTLEDECQTDAECGDVSRFCGYDANFDKRHCMNKCTGRPT